MSDNTSGGGGAVVLLLLVAIAAHLLGYGTVATVAFWGAVALIGLGVLVVVAYLLALVWFAAY